MRKMGIFVHENKIKLWFQVVKEQNGISELYKSDFLDIKSDIIKEQDHSFQESIYH